MWEARTSTLQSLVLSSVSARLSYTILPGPSPMIVFPKEGPTDIQLGYSRVPGFRERFERSGFDLVEQARFSIPLARLARLGISPPYRDTTLPGLVLRDASGEVIFDAADGRAVFRAYDDIPPLVVRSLLFIEDRELDHTGSPGHNPAVDWSRFATAGLLYGGRKLGLDLPVQGGSTLATQIEKYRHSPSGRTDDALEKLRQMTSASLKVYRGGRDTRSARREIVLEYLNTLPLAATRAEGEVHGLGDGLRAWFGLDPRAVRAALARDGVDREKAVAFRHALALIYAAHAPSHFLVRDRETLEAKIDAYLPLMAEAGVVDPELAALAAAERLVFRAPVRGATPPVRRKAVQAVREDLRVLLGSIGPYELDRLDLAVDTTLDGRLQAEVERFFRGLHDPRFVRERGLTGERLLPASGEGAEAVQYSLLLFERTPDGNLLRVQADSLDRPFDLNEGMKLELGSTAKLRTLVHYLELVAELHATLGSDDAEARAVRRRGARDPLTAWAAETYEREPGLALETMLERALERSYSASPGEAFFTGGGLHRFRNFDRDDDGRRLTVREAAYRSTNLVYVRLMRDLVRYHEARLPYDAHAVLLNPDDPERRRMLGEIAEAEAFRELSRHVRGYRGLEADAAARRLLGEREPTARRLALLFFAWHPGADESDLARWLARRGHLIDAAEARRWRRAYGRPGLTPADYGYLLDRHPIEVFCAGELRRRPEATWEELVDSSAEVRREASAWLLRDRNRRAQDQRLRIRIERDAFARMTPAWRRLGFPFESLVPSLATAIGSSSDRPSALAELMGTIVSDGLRAPALSLTELRFGEGTPYHTVFRARPAPGERVLPPEIPRVLRSVLAGVVERGTARRLSGVFHGPDGERLTVGGKTGSGDNRIQKVGGGGERRAARATSRTATFVFFLGDRHFGVITASVAGAEAESYRFTSALPLSVLKLLAPALEPGLGPRSPSEIALATKRVP